MGGQSAELLENAKGGGTPHTMGAAQQNQSAEWRQHHLQRHQSLAEWQQGV